MIASHRESSRKLADLDLGHDTRRRFLSPTRNAGAFVHHVTGVRTGIRGTVSRPCRAFGVG